MRQFLEKRIVKAADKIVTVVDNISLHYKNKYKLNGDRVFTITNGFDPVDREEYFNKELTNKKKFVIVYTGSVYGFRAPNSLFQALRRMKYKKLDPIENIEVQFVGNLDKKVPNDYGLADVVKTYGYVPHTDVLDFLKKADVLLLIIGKVNKNIAYTGKVFEYLMTGKPILAITEKDSIVANLLWDARVGYIVEPEDVSGIQKAIIELYRKWEMKSLVTEPNWSLIEKFDRRKLTARLANIFDQATDSDGIEQGSRYE